MRARAPPRHGTNSDTNVRMIRRSLSSKCENASVKSYVYECVQTREPRTWRCENVRLRARAHRAQRAGVMRDYIAVSRVSLILLTSHWLIALTMSPRSFVHSLAIQRRNGIDHAEKMSGHTLDTVLNVARVKIYRDMIITIIKSV